jgi:tRNA(fMet)-specific endonuclease VapC
MLDTCACIDAIKGKPGSQNLIKNITSLKIGELCVSAITVAELMVGVEKGNVENREKNLKIIQEFLSPIELLDWPQRASNTYAEIRSTLEAKGTPIGSNDTLIAAHALYSGITLITNNTKEFCRVDGLKVENWLRGEEQ